ncbi:MAG: PepSY domain-containing protein [Planctomycetota bacterium]|nr:MAG: PepSY domain-containing protein [Planctomycetota bacterium]
MSRNPTVKFVNKWSRKTHRWGAVAIALPIAAVIGSGILLQLKKDVAWIQPPTARGAAGGDPDNGMTVSMRDILDAAMTVPEAGFTGWGDIDRLDVRPDKGVAKVRGKNRWEVQVDTATGEVVQVAYRRSDLIESIHDGSWFHAAAKLWVFLPSGVVLFILWLTGVYLWALPIWARRAGRRRRAGA